MTNTSKLFRELRKMGYVAKQRAADCRSCAQAIEPTIEVYTTDQSYGKNNTTVYFQVIEGAVILEAVQKLEIPHIWNGKDSRGFTIIEGIEV